MPSLQSAAPGAKSSKMKALNPFTPFLAQPGDLDGNDDDNAPSETLSESLDRRLRVSKPQMSGQQPQYTTDQPMQQQHVSAGPSAPTVNTPATAGPKSEEKKETETVASYDSDPEEFDDDDEALQAFRQRRLAEIQKEHGKVAEQHAKGHGEVRTIVQDEFLPECTGSSKYVCVHFFHEEFERCKIMDKHLNQIASHHLTCKFVRINAEKAPFFVTKLTIKTLPTLIIFKDGKTIERLLGFEGLSDVKNPDNFPTSRLGYWLEKTGSIEYEGPDSDEEVEAQQPTNSRRGLLSSRFKEYDEDF